MSIKSKNGSDAKIKEDRWIDVDSVDLSTYVPGGEAERKLLRKIDFRLVPSVWILYTLSYLDRSNIGNAYAAGMAESLNMSANDYSLVLLVFFISYVLFEVPSNMLLTRVRPSLYLSALCVIWGLIALAMGFVHSVGALAGVRFALGVVEAGFSPGVAFYMSSWYRSHEIAKRWSVYYTAVAISGAFSGLLAGVIVKYIPFALGYEGWRWLFIIEGSVSAFVGLFTWTWMDDYPQTSRWLTAEEKLLCAQRLAADSISGTQAGVEEPSHWQAFLLAVSDWRVWYLAVMYMLSSGAQTIQYFIPTLVGFLGYAGFEKQFMTIPIYAVCLVCILFFCFMSDIRKERYNWIAYACALAVVSYIIVAAQTNIKVQYAFLALGTGGIYAACPVVLMTVPVVITSPSEKRAISIAFVNALGQSASIYGSFLWPASSGPRYTMGFTVTTVFVFLLCFMAPAMRYFVKKFPHTDKWAARQVDAERETAATH